MNQRIFGFITKRSILLSLALVLTLFTVMHTISVNAVSTKTWVPTTGGSWTTSGNWSPSGAPLAGDNVIINSNQSGNITNVPTISLGSLTVSGNVMLAAASSGNTITISNTMSVASGKTLTLGASGARIVFTLNGTGTVDGTLAFDAGTTVRNFTVNGTLIVNSTGQVVDPALSAGSAFILSSGATLKTGKTGGISTSTTTNANVAVNFGGTYSYSTGANYEYVGAANQAAGNGLPSTVASLVINNSGGVGNNTVTLASSETITNNLTLSSGILSLGSFTTHTANSLIFGSTQQSSGTWGSTSSTATNKNDTYFAGTGKVTIASGGSDTTAPVLSAVTPASSTIINNVTTTSALAFTTDEALASGSVTITRTSGTADASSPHICTLIGNALTTGAHTISLTDTTNSCTSDVSDLVSGAVYTIAFATQDVPLNPITSVTRTGVTFNSNLPTITDATSSLADGTYAEGQVVDIQLTFSEAVTSTGSVTILLDTGGSCTFTVSASSTAGCNYTVASGEDTLDLQIASISGDIKNNALSSVVNFVPATNLATNKAIVIDTTAPSAPVASPSSGLYNSSQSVTLSATGSNEIRYTTTGIPTNCNDGNDYVGAISVNTSQTLYVLACDAAGNSSSGSFAYTIDTTPPSTPVANPSTGTYNSNQSITLSSSGSTVIRYSVSSMPSDCTAGTTYTAAISVTSSQTLYVLACDAAGNTSSAAFVYTIDTDAPLSPVASPVASTYNSTQSVTLSASGSTTIRYSTISTPADCTSGTVYSSAIAVSVSQTLYVLSCDEAGNSSSGSFVYVIDSVPPATPSASPTPGTYGASQVVTLSASGSTTIRYSTSSQPTDCSSATEYTGGISVNSSATLYALACDIAGNSSSASFAYIIDTISPTITNITSSLADGVYAAGHTVPINLTFSEQVTSSGNITLTFNSGGNCTFSVAASSTGLCNYTVLAGENSADLTVTTISGTIRDVALNNVTDFVPGTNLAVNKAIVINTLSTPPVVDSDNDGLLNTVEQTAPNTGDANDDGVQDSVQSNVTSLMSPITSNYVVLETTCTSNDSVVVTPEASINDVQYGYPAGLLNFTLSCGVGATAIITQYFYGMFDITKTVARKYNSNTQKYSTVSEAQLANVTVGGVPALKITYAIVDGSALDEDGLANGIIVDPLGPAVLADTTNNTAIHAPDTGIQNKNPLTLWAYILSGIIILTGVTVLQNQRQE